MWLCHNLLESLYGQKVSFLYTKGGSFVCFYRDFFRFHTTSFIDKTFVGHRKGKAHYQRRPINIPMKPWKEPNFIDMQVTLKL